VACSELSTLMIAYRTPLTDDNFLLFFSLNRSLCAGSRREGTRGWRVAEVQDHYIGSSRHRTASDQLIKSDQRRPKRERHINSEQ
jgi:hypothetical protein